MVQMCTLGQQQCLPIKFSQIYGPVKKKENKKHTHAHAKTQISEFNQHQRFGFLDTEDIKPVMHFTVKDYYLKID